jgi:glycosyltransferase involved in cell wall biosynthesis
VKVLIFVDYFTPAYKAGGPIRIFEAVARSASKENPVFIATQNQDWGESAPLSGVPENQWHRFENAQVLYTSRCRRKLSKISALINEVGPSAIHINSLFSRTWTLKVLLLNRFGKIKNRTHVYLSPHGELASSALGLKPWRKRAFLAIAKAVGLFNGLEWIATSAKEIDEIRVEIGSRAKIKFVPPPFPQVYPHAPSKKVPGTLRMIFLARLSAMKNIQFLLAVLPKVRGKVNFDIYGPVDPQFAVTWSETLARLRKENPLAKIDYLGPVPSSESTARLAEYDLFVQPSLSENFGYSIVEALSAGTPVLISDRTPWNEINSVRIGAALALDNAQPWIEALQSFIDMDLEEWRGYSERAQAWVKTKNAFGEALLKIYGSSFADDSEGDQKHHSPKDAKSAN